MDRKILLDYTQKEIKENFNILKFKLEIITMPFKDFLFKINKLLCLAFYNRSGYKPLWFT